MFANRVRDCFAALLQFAANLCCGFEGEIRMGGGVIRNHMTALLYFKGYVGAFTHVAADHEKCCQNVVLRQHVQKIPSVGVVWAVVESKRDLLGSAWEAAECATEPLPSRR